MNLIKRPRTIAVNDPFADFNHLFNGFFPPTRWRNLEQSEFHSPHVDIAEDETSYTVKADLPGVDKKDIDVSIHDNILSIEAKTEESNEEKDDKKGTIIRKERRVGKYLRQFTLGANINADDTSADFTNGVLTLTIPKATPVEPKPRKVNVS